MSDQETPHPKRKRAAMACNYCRKRKRKCDGKQPICSLCESTKNPYCEYRDLDRDVLIHNRRTPESSDQTSSINGQIQGFIRRAEAFEKRAEKFDRRAAAFDKRAEDFDRRAEALVERLEPQEQIVRDLASQHSHNRPGRTSVQAPQAQSESGPLISPSEAAPTPASSHHHAAGAAAIAGGGGGGITPASHPLSGTTQEPGAPQFWFQLPPRPADLGTAMSIPLSHSTTTSSLLRSDAVRALLGMYPPEVFFHAEQKRPLPASLALAPVPAYQVNMPSTLPDEAEKLAGDYFARVHVFHPVLDEAEFREILADVVGRGFPRNTASALVLVVLALAVVANASETDRRAAGATWVPGEQFMSPAIKIILEESLQSFGDNRLLPLAAYLAAQYFGYLARPLQAWRLVHLASTEVQHYCIRKRNVPPTAPKEQYEQTTLRLCLAIFILESDILAEYHFPRSGIENVAEQLPFPRVDSQSEASTYMLRWLANISSRRLLNRIHFAVYDGLQGGEEPQEGTPGSNINPAATLPASLFKVSDELEHQLHAWFDRLPDAIKPGVDGAESDCGHAIISMRYHAAGEIIHRPFLQLLCTAGPDAASDHRVVERARLCLHHCRGYLRVVEHAVQAPSASLEIYLHSTLAVILLLTVGSFSPALAPGLEDIGVMQDKAINMLQKWAFPGSAIEIMLSIVTTLKVKCIGRASGS